jgi:hypothetical protein
VTTSWRIPAGLPALALLLAAALKPARAVELKVVDFDGDLTAE